LLTLPEPRLKYHTRAEQLRKQLGLSQTKAAEILGVSKNTWVRWEQGKTKSDAARIDLLYKLAKEKRPEPCEMIKADGKFNWGHFEIHIRGTERRKGCPKCQELVAYLAGMLWEKKRMAKEPYAE